MEQHIGKSLTQAHRAAPLVSVTASALRWSSSSLALAWPSRAEICSASQPSESGKLRSAPCGHRSCGSWGSMPASRSLHFLPPRAPSSTSPALRAAAGVGDQPGWVPLLPSLLQPLLLSWRRSARDLESWEVTTVCSFMDIHLKKLIKHPTHKLGDVECGHQTKTPTQ